MFGFMLGVGKRARLELEAALLSLSDRLEQLETAPPPSHSPEQLTALLDGVRVGLDERLGGVETRFDALESDIESHTDKLKRLTFAVEEGIERVSRSERRIDATIKRARKELAVHGYESPGLEGEAAELRLVDGGGSEEGEVPALPEGVGPPLEAPSSIKGVSAETLRRVRSF